MGRRGDVARALFYMDVRYEGLAGEEEPDLILTPGHKISHGARTAVDTSRFGPRRPAN